MRAGPRSEPSTRRGGGCSTPGVCADAASAAPEPGASAHPLAQGGVERRAIRLRGTLGGVRVLTALPDAARAAFRSRVSGDPTGAPDWVRDIARVGTGPGWFEPDGVVWRGGGGLSTPLGGGAALPGQGAPPLPLARAAQPPAHPAGPWEGPARPPPPPVG